MRWNYHTLQTIHAAYIAQATTNSHSSTTLPASSIEKTSLPGLNANVGGVAEVNVAPNSNPTIGDDITLSSRGNDEEEGEEEEVSKGESDLTVLTGTHVFSAWEKRFPREDQAEVCRWLAGALQGLWSAWNTQVYVDRKEEVKRLLREMKQGSKRCVVGGAWNGGMQWTFPLTMRADQPCSEDTARMLRKGSWLRGTKVLVPWFLLRPDLVTLEELAAEHAVSLSVFVSLGTDPKSAAFNREGCPRFKTILRNREVYQQRLLLVAISDISYQLSKLSSSVKVSKLLCDEPPSTESHVSLKQASSALQMPLSEQDLRCPAKTATGKSPSASGHMLSLSSMQLFNGERLEKVTVKDSSRTTLVFVAGLEGVGHHMFARLGARHTVRELYDALTNYLCDAAWNDRSEQLYAPARERLVEAMRRLTTAPNLYDGSRVFFLNTVFVEKAVNMYSYPWGGPRCYLKRFARVICNIDTIEIAKMANEAGVDLRIVVLKRSIGAAVVSASLHRPYGTVVSETRMLIQSWALLREGINALDPKFTMEITYEELLTQPIASAKKLADHLNVPVASPLHRRFEKELTSSGATHPIGDVNKWKKEVTPEDLQYMTDILYLPKS